MADKVREDVAWRQDLPPSSSVWCYAPTNHHERGMGSLLCPEAKFLVCNTQSHISPLSIAADLGDHSQGVRESTGDCVCVSVGM